MEHLFLIAVFIMDHAPQARPPVIAVDQPELIYTRAGIAQCPVDLSHCVIPHQTMKIDRNEWVVHENHFFTICISLE